MADQISHNAGHGDIGYMNPLLYHLANSSRYATDFFDVTKGNNNTFGCTPDCYDASPGWDAVTGLGSPDAAELLPDLVTAACP